MQKLGLIQSLSQKLSPQQIQFIKLLQVPTAELETRIEDYDGENLVLSDGTSIRSKILIWAAGVSGEPMKGLKESDYARGGRIAVDRKNKLPNYENIFAVGDIAYMETEKYPHGHPQVAQVAIQQANLLGRNFKSTRFKDFEYNFKGDLATIGRSMAVADLPGMRFSGYFAWLLWLFVHLMAIVGVKNRFFIFINWAQSYFSRDQSLRILIRPFKR